MCSSGRLRGRIGHSSSQLRPVVVTRSLELRGGIGFLLSEVQSKEYLWATRLPVEAGTLAH